jgi:hypothetical protein
MAKDKPHDWKDIEINIGSRTVKGTYYVEKGMVIARAKRGTAQRRDR